MFTFPLIYFFVYCIDSSLFQGESKLTILRRIQTVIAENNPKDYALLHTLTKKDEEHLKQLNSSADNSQDMDYIKNDSAEKQIFPSYNQVYFLSTYQATFRYTELLDQPESFWQSLQSVLIRIDDFAFSMDYEEPVYISSSRTGSKIKKTHSSEKAIVIEG